MDYKKKSPRMKNWANWKVKNQKQGIKIAGFSVEYL